MKQSKTLKPSKNDVLFGNIDYVHDKVGKSYAWATRICTYSRQYAGEWDDQTLNRIMSEFQGTKYLVEEKEGNTKFYRKATRKEIEKRAKYFFHDGIPSDERNSQNDTKSIEEEQNMKKGDDVYVYEHLWHAEIKDR
jgi:DNA mismatch repair ATPase MutL